MFKIKNKAFLISFLVVPFFVSCSRQNLEHDTKTTGMDSRVKVVASTTWTAAIADIAGCDVSAVIAPAEMLHPSEYEVTVDDVVAIRSCDLFVYAGFERMMKTLGDNIGNEESIKVKCDNSLETIKADSHLISVAVGTSDLQEERLAEYAKTIEECRARVGDLGLSGAMVYCHKMQVPLAKEMGFEIAATFGPGPLTADQIALAGSGNFKLIIDNVHNPVAKPIREIAPDIPIVTWRNFPAEIGRGALAAMVRENIAALPTKSNAD